MAHVLIFKVENYIIFPKVLYAKSLKEKIQIEYHVLIPFILKIQEWKVKETTLLKILVH